MFKFQKVEIELLAFYKDITVEHVLVKLRKLKFMTRITFGYLTVTCFVYVFSYLVCEMTEIIGGEDSEQIKYLTKISKTLQIVIQTPFYLYLIFLTLKFSKMTMYLHKKFNGLDELHTSMKTLIIMISLTFILNYLLDVALYTYPFIELTIQKYLLPDDVYNYVQQSILVFNAINRFLKGCVMAFIVANLLKKRDE